MKIYNEAKYFEPPLPFRSFVRHISKHLPWEVQITLMTREITDINELEKILDIFQNIRDREIGRHQNPPKTHNNGSNSQPRGLTTGHGGTRVNNNGRDEGWRCSSCRF